MLADECAPGFADSIARLHRFARDLIATPDLNAILQKALLAAAQLTCAHHATLLLLDESGQQIHYRVALDSGNLAPLELIAKPMMSKGLAGLVARDRVTALVEDTEQDPRWLPGPGLGDLRSAVVAPLIYSDQVLAILTLGSETPKHFGAAHLQLVEILGAQTALAIQLARVEGTSNICHLPHPVAELPATPNPTLLEQEMIALAVELRGLSTATAKLAHGIFFEQELDRYIQANSTIIRRYNGMMVQTDSETLLAVFEAGYDGARAAAQAALELQASFQQRRADWQQHFGIRVGMLNIGIGQGTTLLGADDGGPAPRHALGMAIAQATRLRKLARGGEILVAGIK
jgi:class 3 adenylate cyclase